MALGLGDSATAGAGRKAVATEPEDKGELSPPPFLVSKALSFSSFEFLQTDTLFDCLVPWPLSSPTGDPEARSCSGEELCLPEASTGQQHQGLPRRRFLSAASE
ncbi:unnamed protein product [Natator depressus]